MLSEPKIDISYIRDTLEKKYKIKVLNLTFVPKGEVSWNYKVEAEDGEYFLKIHVDGTLPDIRFNLVFDLYSKAGIKNIIHPIKTIDGETLFYINQFPAVLFNYINGVNGFEENFTNGEKIEIGRVLGQLHKAKDKIGEYSIKESFEFSFNNDLLGMFEDGEKYDSEFKNEVKELLFMNKHKIFDQLDYLTNLGSNLKDTVKDFVICHGDLHQGNILATNEGEIYFIDWDDPIFAPKEKDLGSFRDDQPVLQGYGEIVGKFEIRLEVLEFYKLRWTLSEIDDWSTRVLFEDHGVLQNNHYLNQLKSELKDLRTQNQTINCKA